MSEEIINGLNKLDEKLEALSKDNTASKSAIDAEIKKLGDSQLELARELRDLQQKSVSVEGGSVADRSVGGQFVATKSFNNFSLNQKAFASIKTDLDPIKTTVSPGVTRTSVVAPGQGRFVGIPDAKLVVEELIPHMPTVSDAIQFVKNTSFTNNAGVAAQGASKAQSTFEFGVKTAPVEVVAHWTRITKQLADDAPALAAYINAKMIAGLNLKVEQQILTGTGTSQLSGLLNTGNYTDYRSVADIDTTNDTLIDFVHRIYTAVSSANFNPEYLILNPVDWQKIALLKDKQGRYMIGGPSVLGQKVLWGIPVVTTGSMTSGKYILADFMNGATIHDRQSIEVAMSDSDANNFTTNLYTLRVERRLALTVENPGAIAGGDFSVTVTG